MKSNINLIIIDSNFILLPFQFKIDYLSEIQKELGGNLRFIIFQQVLDELEAKKKRELRSTKFKRLLDSGLLYLEKNKEKYAIEYLNDIRKNDELTDDFLIRKVKQLKKKSQNVFLATNDSELRKKARLINIDTIFLRQKKYLVIERM